MITDIMKFADRAHSIASSLNATLVVLGRDAWPIVTYLRSTGRRCQYFLFSRLQLEDSSTREQWLREIPPRNIVVDTGFQGTIIQAIMDIDPTCLGGFLMSSSQDSYVPKLRTSYSEEDNRDDILGLEHNPKIVNRTVGYKDNQAITSDDTDDNDSGLNANIQQYLICRNMGLSYKIAHKYARFTGISANERIGCSGYEYREHYLQVKRQRLAYGEISVDDAYYLYEKGHITEKQYWSIVQQHPQDTSSNDVMILRDSLPIGNGVW